MGNSGIKKISRVGMCKLVPKAPAKCRDVFFFPVYNTPAFHVETRMSRELRFQNLFLQ